MIDTALRQVDHSILGLVGRGIYDIIRVGAQSITDYEITEIAKNIISVPLFILTHNLSVFCFVIGFIFSEQVAWLADKVNTVIQAQGTFFRGHVLVLGGGFLVVFFQPTTMYVAAAYLAANLGAKLYNSSHSRLEQIQQQQQNAPQ